MRIILLLTILLCPSSLFALFGENTNLSGCIFYYKMESGTSTFTDSSGNGFDGTGEGITIENVDSPAKFGKAIQFSPAAAAGTCLINGGKGGIKDNLTTITIMAWIRVHTFVTSGGGNRRMVDKGPGIKDWYFTSAGNSTWMHAFSGTDGIWRSPLNLSANTWYCEAITYDGSSTANKPIWYNNGNSEGTSSTTSTPTGTIDADDANDWIILNALSGGVGVRAFDGECDEFMIFNRVLTPKEIKEYYDRTKQKYNTQVN